MTTASSWGSLTVFVGWSRPISSRKLHQNMEETVVGEGSYNNSGVVHRPHMVHKIIDDRLVQVQGRGDHLHRLVKPRWWARVAEGRGKVGCNERNDGNRSALGERSVRSFLFGYPWECVALTLSLSPVFAPIPKPTHPPLNFFFFWTCKPLSLSCGLG